MLAPTLYELTGTRPIGRPSLETIGRWAMKYKACTRCGTTERRHKARGLCLRCYMLLAKRKERA